MGLTRLCCGITIGESIPFVELPSIESGGEEQTLATVTVAVIDSVHTVRLMASIPSSTFSSTVNTSPLQGNTVVYEVRREDNSSVISVFNTDFDLMQTTFIAFDNPGQGTFTYTLVGRIIRETSAQGEVVYDYFFTAEELVLENDAPPPRTEPSKSHIYRK